MSLSTDMIRLVGMDPSLRNWGVAIADYEPVTQLMHLREVGTLCPILSTGKQVRQNSLDIESAYQLYQGAVKACQGAHAIFVECPVGSKSARAMASYGLCAGVLGALRANHLPFFEVTATEVKLAGAGTKTASKDDMIQWAKDKHPNAPWAHSLAKAEHQADALAVIYAGLASNPFRQMLPFLAAKS